MTLYDPNDIAYHDPDDDLLCCDRCGKVSVTVTQTADGICDECEAELEEQREREYIGVPQSYYFD